MTAYKIQPERAFALDDVVEPAKRSRARTICASSAGKFAWLRMDVCATMRGPSGTKVERVTSSTSVVDICREFAAQYMNLQEFFGVLCLDSGQKPIGFAVVSVGGVASAPVDVRILFKPVLLSTAAAMIITHNHPSGNPQPSQDDIELTRRILNGAKLLGVQLLDHVIVAEKESFSFLDSGLLTSMR